MKPPIYSDDELAAFADEIPGMHARWTLKYGQPIPGMVMGYNVALMLVRLGLLVRTSRACGAGFGRTFLGAAVLQFLERKGS